MKLTIKWSPDEPGTYCGSVAHNTTKTVIEMYFRHKSWGMYRTGVCYNDGRPIQHLGEFKTVAEANKACLNHLNDKTGYTTRQKQERKMSVEIRWVKTPNPDIVQGLRSDMKDIKPPTVIYMVMKNRLMRCFLAARLVKGAMMSVGIETGYATKNEAKEACLKDANRPIPEPVLKLCDILYIDPPRFLTQEDIVAAYGEKDPKLCEQLWAKVSIMQGM